MAAVSFLVHSRFDGTMYDETNGYSVWLMSTRTRARNIIYLLFIEVNTQRFCARPKAMHFANIQITFRASAHVR